MHSFITEAVDIDLPQCDQNQGLKDHMPPFESLDLIPTMILHSDILSEFLPFNTAVR